LHAQDKVTVRLSFTPQADHAALHLAKEKGWFSREGLDVDVQDGTGSLNTLQLIAADQVDIGQVQLGGMAVALEKKLPLKSFAGFMPVGDSVVMVARDSGINTLADLKGKKILCFTASPATPFIDSLLARAKLDRTSVNVTMVAPGAMYSLYSAKETDGLVTIGWYGLPLVEKTRPSKVFLLADYGISYPSYGLVASTKTLDGRKEMLRKFTKVQVETWEYIWKGNIQEAAQAIIKQRPGMKLDPDVVTAQIELIRPHFFTEATKGKRIGWQATSDWVAAIKSMKDAGVIAGTLKPEDYFTNAFIPD
jgi:NitT/TauT family transport system substrate-binding protein